MLGKLLIVLVSTVLFIHSIYGQEVVQDDSWLYLKGGQSALGVEFRKDGTVFFNSGLLMRCNYMEGAGDVYISKPSAKKGLSLVKCVYDDIARIIDTKQNKVLSRNIIPKGESLGHWASWSPDERYFVSVVGGEGINTIFFIVNLTTFQVRKIPVKVPTKNIEMHDFQEENFTWINNSAFRVRIDIVCNPYESYECTEQNRSKVIRSSNVQVNVATLTTAYGTPQPKISRTLPQRRTNQRSTQLEFTINRECDGGLCHFEIVSFNYRRNLTISVGRGDSSLSYYFSVHITNGKVSKEYIYSDEPEEHFIEKESGQKVDSTLNKLLLDVYNLGNYIVENDIAIRNRKFSETGRFAVLANLRSRF